MAQFANDNAPKMAVWLQEVADGNPDADRKPDPARALDLYLRAIEYHVPKLQRQEVAGDPNNPVRTHMTVEFVKP